MKSVRSTLQSLATRLEMRNSELEDDGSIQGDGLFEVFASEEAKVALSDLLAEIRRAGKGDSQTSWSGLLLSGPAGSGKTALMQVMASEAGIALLRLDISQLSRLPYAVREERLKRIFQEAETGAPALLFFDQVSDEEETERIVQRQILPRLAGLDRRLPVRVAAASRNPETLIPTWLGTGCLDRWVALGLPDSTARQAILKTHTARLSLRPDVNLGLIARTTSGLSGASLACVCRQAAMQAHEEGHQQVSMADFETALDRVLLNCHAELLAEDNARLALAYHEAGHLLTSWIAPGAVPVEKACLLEHMHPLVGFDPDGEKPSALLSYPVLKTQLWLLLSGLAAEDIAQLETSERSNVDWIEARRLASTWVDGESTQNAQQILVEAFGEIKEVLIGQRELLDLLATELFEEETIRRETTFTLLSNTSLPLDRYAVQV